MYENCKMSPLIIMLTLQSILLGAMIYSIVFDYLNYIYNRLNYITTIDNKQ